jgi:hypothetical protein
VYSGTNNTLLYVVGLLHVLNPYSASIFDFSQRM